MLASDRRVGLPECDCHPSGRVSRVVHRDHRDLGITIHTEREPGADAAGDIEVGQAVAVESCAVTVGEGEVGARATSHGDLAAVGVAGQCQRHALLGGPEVRSRVVGEEQVRERPARAIDVPSTGDRRLGPVDPGDDQVTVATPIAQRLVAKQCHAGRADLTGQLVRIVKLIMIPQHHDASHGGRYGRQRIQQRRGFVMMQIDQVTGTRDDVRFQGGDQLHDLDGVRERKKITQMEVADVGDAKTVELRRPSGAVYVEFVDAEAAGEMATTETTSGEPIRTDREQDASNPRATILASSLAISAVRSSS